MFNGCLRTVGFTGNLKILNLKNKSEKGLFTLPNCCARLKMNWTILNHNLCLKVVFLFQSFSGSQFIYNHPYAQTLLKYCSHHTLRFKILCKYVFLNFRLKTSKSFFYKNVFLHGLNMFTHFCVFVLYTCTHRI